jgi:hypothetical protein
VQELTAAKEQVTRLADELHEAQQVQYKHLRKITTNDPQVSDNNDW